mmetsp:Transcript_11135/g.23446  ORF Transcript_11135/g.23446 Transcript_11135/m.23446 type:complete len:240 (+) Transcript_11135:217-936(+)
MSLELKTIVSLRRCQMRHGRGQSFLRDLFVGRFVDGFSRFVGLCWCLRLFFGPISILVMTTSSSAIVDVLSAVFVAIISISSVLLVRILLRNPLLRQIHTQLDQPGPQQILLLLRLSNQQHLPLHQRLQILLRPDHPLIHEHILLPAQGRKLPLQQSHPSIQLRDLLTIPSNNLLQLPDLRFPTGIRRFERLNFVLHPLDLVLMSPFQRRFQLHHLLRLNDLGGEIARGQFLLFDLPLK